MSSLPEQADLLDDSHPSDAAFQRKKFSINANESLLPNQSASTDSAAYSDLQTTESSEPGNKRTSCPRAFRNSILRTLWSLRFQRPWEWSAWLQTAVFALVSLLIFRVLGELPEWLGVVGDKQLPTPAADSSTALFQAIFEPTVPDLSFNIFSPSPGAVYTVLSCGMFFIALILLTMQ